MAFYNNGEWIGYLADNIIQKCISLSMAECSGCRDGMKSYILHLHNQMSLLMKLQQHFEPVRAETLKLLNELYKTIEMKLPHSDDKKKDMAIYCNIGRTFLITLSPEALYYGRYVNEMNDSFLAEMMNNKEKRGTKKKKCNT